MSHRMRRGMTEPRTARPQLITESTGRLVNELHAVKVTFDMARTDTNGPAGWLMEGDSLEA
jgi:hypothetical protein